MGGQFQRNLQFVLCLIGISSWSLNLNKRHIHNGDSASGKVNSIYGEWSEKKSHSDSAKSFKVIFFPGGKINVIRKLHNYIGYYQIHNDKLDYVDGAIIIAEKYPFTATFIEPNEIKLVINFHDRAETKYLVKTKEIKSGFQLID